MIKIERSRRLTICWMHSIRPTSMPKGCHSLFELCLLVSVLLPSARPLSHVSFRVRTINCASNLQADRLHLFHFPFFFFPRFSFRPLPLSPSPLLVDPNHIIRTTIALPASTGRNSQEILRIVDSLQLGDKYRVTTPVNWVPGEKVIVHPSVQSGEEAEKLFPGYETVKPYLRFAKDPSTAKKD